MSEQSISPPATGSRNAWDSSLYDESFAVITRLGAGVLDLLAPRPGERILDLGCGTGALTAQIGEAGVTVVGIDASDEMVTRARERFPSIEFRVGRGESFAVDEPFDALFSSAALHWMAPPEAVAQRMFAALRPGGRLVAEMGGKGNVKTIIDAIHRALGEAGVPPQRMPMPWYFPSIGEYAAILERAGFEVRSMLLFDRPTPLDDCPEGVADWVRMFGDDFLAPVPTERRADVARRASALAEPALKRDGRWLADYRRLRFIAVRCM